MRRHSGRQPRAKRTPRRYLQGHLLSLQVMHFPKLGSFVSTDLVFVQFFQGCGASCALEEESRAPPRPPLRDFSAALAQENSHNSRGGLASTHPHTLSLSLCPLVFLFLCLCFFVSVSVRFPLPLSLSLTPSLSRSPSLPPSPSLPLLNDTSPMSP